MQFVSLGPRLCARYVPALVAATLVLAGCARVIESDIIGPNGYGYYNGGPLCHSALGHYFLPKAMLSITATADKAAGTQTADWTMEPHADRSQAFCLDYLESVTSKDIVTVQRTDEGLLQTLNANVEDRTPAIVTSLVQTAENLTIAAAREAGVPGPDLDTVKFQFDPFVWDELILAKSELRRFNLCIYVEGFSFPTDGMSSAQILAAARRWCSLDAHATQRYEPPIYAFANQPVPREVLGSGIMYRPTAPYRLVMLHQKSGVWELYRNKQFDMPNASPVLSIGIERAVFTTRKTSLVFNNGTLTDVAIDKSSELEGFVQIPLAVAQAIVDIPAQIVQIRLSDVQSHEALIQAQGNLITASAAYANLLATGGRDAPRAGGLAGSRSTAARSGQFIGGCINAGGDAKTCGDIAAGQK
jgi:hypothetical protein